MNRLPTHKTSPSGLKVNLQGIALTLMILTSFGVIESKLNTDTFYFSHSIPINYVFTLMYEAGWLVDVDLHFLWQRLLFFILALGTTTVFAACFTRQYLPEHHKELIMLTVSSAVFGNVALAYGQTGSWILSALYIVFVYLFLRLGNRLIGR
ncbi:MAG: hypothetical protein HWE13_07655 [Gammaproteobacteria bacterium]|nr:hypothetical protein [Gammaproteobacteria bacterium]NVK87985.1 hypothetical protein [Gammaproteobacteria bacterium]